MRRNTQAVEGEAYNIIYIHGTLGIFHILLVYFTQFHTCQIYLICAAGVLLCPNPKDKTFCI